MGSLGIPEILFILVIALLLFGPKRLPEIGRTLGKGMAEFRKASNDLKRTINAELSIDESAQSPLTRRWDLPSIAQSILPLNEVEERPAPPQTLAFTPPPASPAPLAPTSPPTSEGGEAPVAAPPAPTEPG